jgi:foldase protein PrsA
MKRQRKSEIFVIVIVIIAAILIAGYMKFFNGKIIYISTGMKKTEFCKVGNLTADMCEADILLSDARREYENIFGEDVWNQSIGDVTFNDYVKEQVKAKLERIYCMNLLAQEKGTALSRTQKENISNAVDAYYATLTSQQISYYSITKEKLTNMFTAFAIAETLYSDMTSAEDVEVSYDDARVIRIQYICADSEEEIKQAQARIENDEVFYVVAKDYNPDEYERECRRGELDSAFEEAAYNLATGEVSDIISANGKYYIIKCSSDNDKSKTEANKTTMEDKKCLELFNQTFEAYEKETYVELNETVWKTKKVSTAEIFDAGFEDIYNQYLN